MQSVTAQQRMLGAAVKRLVLRLADKAGRRSAVCTLFRHADSQRTMVELALIAHPRAVLGNGG